MSPGRNPRRSPASTAGRVRMRRATLRSRSAMTPIAALRKVFPVPAGPIEKTRSFLRIASMYVRWFGDCGVMRLPRTVVPMTSRICSGGPIGASFASPMSRSSAGLRSDSSRSEIERIAPTSSPTRATWDGSPLMRSSAPRDTIFTSNSRSIRSMFWSFMPVTNIISSGSGMRIVICDEVLTLRLAIRSCAGLRLELGLHDPRDLFAVGFVLRQSEHLRHDLPHVARTRRTAVGDRLLDDRADLRFTHLLRQILGDDDELLLFFVDELGAPAFAEGLDRVAPHLRLFLEHVLHARVVDLARVVLREVVRARRVVLPLRDELVVRALTAVGTFALNGGQHETQGVTTER